MVLLKIQPPPSEGVLLLKYIKMISKQTIFDHLQHVIDPELGISIVRLGLVYDVSLSPIQEKDGSSKIKVHILMTLTTPGCPLAAVFDGMVRDALFGIDGVNPDHDVTIELTFDPPWVPDMMDEEAKAELGF